MVDYLGLADQLKKALITDTESGGQDDPIFDTAKAIAAMLEKHGIACDMMHGLHDERQASRASRPFKARVFLTSDPGVAMGWLIPSLLGLNCEATRRPQADRR